MSFKDTAARKAMSVTLSVAVNHLRKDPDKNIPLFASRLQKFFGNMFPSDNFKKMAAAAKDKNNTYVKLIKNLLNDVDPSVLKKLLTATAYDAGVVGTKTVRANREKLNCNIPWLILMDPTSACNLKCKGCWAAEYGHKLNLTLDEMSSVIRQGKELGTHVYMYTGGEPLIRKNDIIKLCERNPDCVFLAYTNSTLIDQAFCDEMKRVGNLVLALSIEGTKESNDARRGDGIYEKTVSAMDLLKKNKLLFGLSVWYGGLSARCCRRMYLRLSK